MKIYLVRHGMSVANGQNLVQGHFDSPLSEVGHEQARKLAKRFEEEDFDGYYCSDLKRAIQTMEQILEYHPGVEPIYSKELREKFFGDYEGASDVHDEVWHTHDMESTPGGGESWRQFRERVEGFFYSLVRKHDKNDRVLLVSHGGVNIILCSIIGNIDLENLRDNFPFDNASVTILDVDKGLEGKIVVLNDSAHL